MLAVAQAYCMLCEVGSHMENSLSRGSVSEASREGHMTSTHQPRWVTSSLSRVGDGWREKARVHWGCRAERAGLYAAWKSHLRMVNRGQPNSKTGPASRTRAKSRVRDDRSGFVVRGGKYTLQSSWIAGSGFVSPTGGDAFEEIVTRGRRRWYCRKHSWCPPCMHIGHVNANARTGK